MNTPVDEWIAREALPFDLNSPETFNAAVDLMAAALGDAPELLGFGEALHGGEDILDLRNRLFQRLVEAHGYSAIAIESSFPRSQIVNEYVAGRGGATYDAVREAGFSHDFGALDANVRKELREWLRRLHDEVHVTTVFVTHDQEEALEVADEIVVVNEGRVEQVGTPDELYDRPANDFVMRFLGPVTELGGVLVRPHDLVLSTDPCPESVEGIVERVSRVGFEVRIVVRTGDRTVLVTQPRSQFLAARVEAGDRVWVRAEVGARVTA